MYQEIKADPDEIRAVLSNNFINVPSIEYSSEWLTTECVNSAITELKKCASDFDKLTTNIKGYALELENISSVNSPDIDKK